MIFFLIFFHGFGVFSTAKIEKSYVVDADFFYFGRSHPYYFSLQTNHENKIICVSSTGYDPISGNTNSPIEVGSNRFMVTRKLDKISTNEQEPSILMGVVFSEIDQSEDFVILFLNKKI